MEKQNKHIDRRGFLKIVGISAATTTAALYGCGSGDKAGQGRSASSPVPTDKMTYRSVGGIKDNVSIHRPYMYRAGRKKQQELPSKGIRVKNCT